MKKFVYPLFFAIFIFAGLQLHSQTSESLQGPTLILTSEPVIEVPSIASQIADGTFIPSENYVKEFNPKKWGSNTSVPGKGLPKGNDPLWEQQINAPKSPGRRLYLLLRLQVRQPLLLILPALLDQIIL